MQPYYAMAEDHPLWENECQFLKLSWRQSSWKFCLAASHWKVAGAPVYAALSCQRLLGMIQCIVQTENLSITWCLLIGVRCCWIGLMQGLYKWLWKWTLTEDLVQCTDKQSLSVLVAIHLKIEEDNNSD